MKHILTFESFLNENLHLDKTDKLIDKMTINDFDGDKWVLNVVEVDNSDPDSPDADEEMYIVLTGNSARYTTDVKTIWIPKPQWEEFKKLINKI